MALSASGTDSATATCTVSTLAEGDHTITATYSDVTNSFNQSVGSYDQRIDNSILTSLSGGVLTYCNTGAIQIPDPNSAGGGAAYPNPSNITVAGLFGTVNTVSVALKNFYDLYPSYLTSLLVGPGGNLSDPSGNAINVDSFAGGTIDIVPEPCSLFLALAGLSLLAGWACRRLATAGRCPATMPPSR